MQYLTTGIDLFKKVNSFQKSNLLPVPDAAIRLKYCQAFNDMLSHLVHNSGPLPSSDGELAELSHEIKTQTSDFVRLSKDDQYQRLIQNPPYYSDHVLVALMVRYSVYHTSPPLIKEVESWNQFLDKYENLVLGTRDDCQ